MGAEEFGVVVTWGQEKYQILSPDVYGPFARREDAEAFANTIPPEPPSGEGGYVAVTVVPPLDWDDPADVYADEDES